MRAHVEVLRVLPVSGLEAPEEPRKHGKMEGGERSGRRWEVDEKKVKDYGCNRLGKGMGTLLCQCVCGVCVWCVCVCGVILVTQQVSG